MKEKTAVEYLENQLRQLAFDDIHHLGMGDIKVTQGMLDDLFRKAKEMEKEQLDKAWQEGAITAQNDTPNISYKISYKVDYEHKLLPNDE